MNIFKYIKLSIRKFIGLESDYESLLSNQEKILQSLEKLENLKVIGSNDIIEINNLTNWKTRK